jgi:cytochrome oxidase Cu insertion factor (SCO1/SenC/PrrC family)
MMGILAGIALGTISAMAYRAYRLANAPVAEQSQSNTDMLAEEDDDDPWERIQAETDPGRRKALAGLVKSAKEQPKWLQEFEYTDQNGNKVTSESLKGQPYIACFFFTTCPGSCPRQSSQMQLLHNKFKDKPIRFVSITVDPEIDTQEKLAEYAKSYGADPSRWFFLYAPIEYTVRVGVEKFFLDGVEKRGHPDRFVLVNANGDAVGSYVWLDIEERELLLKHIDEVLAESSK